MSGNAQQGKLDIIDCSGVGVTAEALAICRIRLDYTMAQESCVTRHSQGMGGKIPPERPLFTRLAVR
jgi:hypothetical protein